MAQPRVRFERICMSQLNYSLSQASLLHDSCYDCSSLCLPLTKQWYLIFTGIVEQIVMSWKHLVFGIRNCLMRSLLKNKIWWKDRQLTILKSSYTQLAYLGNVLHCNNFTAFSEPFIKIEKEVPSLIVRNHCDNFYGRVSILDLHKTRITFFNLIEITSWGKEQMKWLNALRTCSWFIRCDNEMKQKLEKRLQQSINYAKRNLPANRLSQNESFHARRMNHFMLEVFFCIELKLNITATATVWGRCYFLKEHAWGANGARLIQQLLLFYIGNH